MNRWLAALAVLALVEGAGAQGVIRLKSGRVIRPDPISRPTRSLASGRHYIVQFAAHPDAAVRTELERRHIRVLGYLPDSGLMVSGTGQPNLDGLGVTWVGPLEAADKISPRLAISSHPALLVVFHDDVSPAAAGAVLDGLGFHTLPNRYLLEGQYVVTGPYRAVSALAARDEVAYILPASPDLVAGNPVMGCGGAHTEAGPVAQYVEVGAGWPKDAAGHVDLQYFFQSLTTKMDESVVRGEIERAFREWQKYAGLTLSPGTKADAVRTIAIQFARGAHGDSYPFDGPHGVLAHTFYPAPPNSEPLAGDMHLDADEDWHAGADTDLFSVVLHETGHALGLGHSDSPGAVMYPYYRFASGLTDDDIAGIRALYGAAGAPPIVPPDPPANPTTPSSDTTPPSLRIQSPASTIVTVSTASIKMSGTASDNVGVTAVKWSTSNGDSGTASGTSSWSAAIPVWIGSTVVTVRAYDAAGNSGWRSVTVVRR